MNPLSQFLTDRFITPQVQAGVQSELRRSTTANAYGVSPAPTMSLKDAIGQAPDSNYPLLYAIYRLHPDVAACVRLWAGGVTGNGWDIALMDGEEPSDAQIKQMDELRTWLKNPNPSKRFYRILFESVQHLAISGDTYIQKVSAGGKLRELWTIHPSTMRVKMSQHGEVQGYVQQVGSSTAVNFAPDEISHLALPSVVSDVYGYSPLESAMEAVGLSLQAMRSNRAMFENGLSPSAIAMTDPEMKMDEQEKAAKMIQQQHAGANKRHKVLIAPLKDFKPWGQTLKDMEFQVLSELTSEQVANAYGVPKLFLNKKESADYATSATQERRFYNTTIKPLQDQIAEVFTEEVIHQINPEFKFVFNEPDFNDPDKVRTDAISLYGRNSKAIDANEIRTKYFGLEAKDESELEPDETTVETPSNAKDQQQETDEPSKAPTSKKLIKALSENERDNLAQQREAEQEALADGAEPSIKQFFNDQRQRHLERLDPTAPNVEAVVSDPQADPLLFAALLPAVNASLNAGSQAAQLQIDMSLSFDQLNPIVTDYLNTVGAHHIPEINSTTRDAIRSTLTQGLKNGESVNELATRIHSVFDDASKNRAKVIARNETAQAYAHANYRTAQATGLRLTRRWLATLDERLCPICAPLHDQTAALDDSYPGGAEPGFVHIQCRCTETFGVAA